MKNAAFVGSLLLLTTLGSASAQEFEHQWGGATLEPWVSADPRHSGESIVWTAEAGPRIGRHETHDGSWTHEPVQLPSGQFTGDLHNIFVSPDASWGVAVGSDGQVYWKEDLIRSARQPWQPFMCPPPTGDANLWESAWRMRRGQREGWIAGEDETLLRTPDGGMTWIRATLPPSRLPQGEERTFNSLGFVDPSAGGTVLAAVGGNDGILCTADGQTWMRAQVTLPPNWASPTTVVWDIDFRPGGLLGFAVGGIGIGNGPGFFLCTQDGGATWLPMSGSTPVPTVYGVTALADGTAIATSYGGGVWRFDGPPAPVWDNVAKAGFGPGLFGTGPLWGAHDDGGSRVFITGQFGEVRRSDDGGRSWRQSRDGAPLMRLRDVASGSDQVAFAVGQPFGIMRTVNGGDTWEAQRSVGLGPNLGGALQAVAAASPRVAVTIGPALLRGTPPKPVPFPTVLVTQDGRSWSLALRGALPAGDVSSDVLTDVTHAPGAFWIVGARGLVWRSLDGGASFQRRALAGISQPRELTLNAVAAVDHRVALAVGKRGSNAAAVITVDGGASWRDASPLTPLAIPLHGVALSGTEGYAVGPQGVILELGRPSLRLQRIHRVYEGPGRPKLTGEDLSAAALAQVGSFQRLIVAGENGAVFVRDHDAARNTTRWRQVPSKTTVRIMGLDLRSPRRGWITGRSSLWGDSSILRFDEN